MLARAPLTSSLPSSIVACRRRTCISTLPARFWINTCLLSRTIFAVCSSPAGLKPPTLLSSQA